MLRIVPMLLLLACETTATIGNLRDAGEPPCRPLPASDGGTGCPNAGEACALASAPMDDHCIVPGMKRPGDSCASTSECEAASACASMVAGLVDLDSVGMGSRCFAVCDRTVAVPCAAPYTCRSVRTPSGDVRVDYGVCVP